MCLQEAGLPDAMRRELGDLVANATATSRRNSVDSTHLYGIFNGRDLDTFVLSS